MKIAIALAAALCLVSTGAHAKGHSGQSSSASRSTSSSHSVKGYTKKNGTRVAPTRATNPDKSKTNNYSHKGNVNPQNGKVGNKSN